MYGTVLGWIGLAGVLVGGQLRDCGGSTSGGGSTPTPTTGGEVAICDGTPIDAYTLDGVSISGDALTVDVAYSGGCGTHDFTLCWDAAWIKTSPMKASLRLVHDGHGDQCKAYILESHTFDMSSLADDTLAFYPSEEGVWLLLDGESVWYAF